MKPRLVVLLAILMGMVGWYLNVKVFKSDGLELGADFPGFQSSVSEIAERDSGESDAEVAAGALRLATFGGGCFWCTEAFFEELEGVVSVRSGYSGGDVVAPSYAEVCEGTTGHAEVVQIEYDPSRITYAELLEVFWRTHDPTTLNRQGDDVGPQYRSIILCHDEVQLLTAKAYRHQLDDSGVFGREIVTEIVPFEVFYSADISHQDYFAQNGDEPYCRWVIGPKLKKFRGFLETRGESP